jgi:hypothetical protein
MDNYIEGSCETSSFKGTNKIKHHKVLPMRLFENHIKKKGFPPTVVLEDSIVPLICVIESIN